jgi:hypothetical protein
MIDALRSGERRVAGGMMEQLISDTDYEGLPEDNAEGFVEFVAKIRGNMLKMLGEKGKSEAHYKAIQSQYMSAVHATASECNIQLPDPPLDISAIHFTKNMLNLIQLFRAKSHSFAFVDGGQSTQCRYSCRIIRGPLSITMSPACGKPLRLPIYRLTARAPLMVSWMN